ncbi:MAG: rod shape-determining protein MreC [Acidobacteria bacterium]|nr:rod shape-determining protein MreC [Acidobacteriota bacterium]
MSERRVLALFLLSSAVLLAVMAVQVRRPDGRNALGQSLRGAADPVASAVYGALGSVRGIWTHYFDLVGTQREKERLARRIDTLEAENLHLRELLQENQRLRRLLDLKDENAFPRGVAARVIADLSGGPFRRAVLVNRGRNDGLATGWVAVRGGALVGRVVKASRKTSEVLLIVDPDSGVGVRHAGDRFSGVLRGGNRGPSLLTRLEYVPRDQAVAVGDAIVTSGLDRLYPPGLLVGYIREISGESPLTWQISVEVAAEPSVLEDILMIPPAGPGRTGPVGVTP